MVIHVLFIDYDQFTLTYYYCTVLYCTDILIMFINIFILLKNFDSILYN